VNPQYPAAAFLQRRQVPQRLCPRQAPETVAGPGHFDVFDVVGGDLQEHAAVRSALVQLPGRMQERRPPAERRRHTQALEQQAAKTLQRPSGGDIRADECLDADVVGGSGPS